MGQQVIRTLTARGLARRMDEGMYELGQEALRLRWYVSDRRTWSGNLRDALTPRTRSQPKRLTPG
jgi:hypothetical protein